MEVASIQSKNEFKYHFTRKYFVLWRHISFLVVLSSTLFPHLRPAPHCSPCTPHWQTHICLIYLDVAMSKPLVIMTNLRGVSYLSTVIIKVEKSRMIVSQKHLETLPQFMMHLFVFTSKPAKFPAERWKVFFLKRPKFDLQPGMVEYEVWIPTVFINSKP